MLSILYEGDLSIACYNKASHKGRAVCTFYFFFSRDSDLRTRFKDVDILKKMWICINISTSFFNISTSYVTKTNISTSFFNISTSTGMWIYYIINQSINFNHQKSTFISIDFHLNRLSSPSTFISIDFSSPFCAF